HQSQPMGGMILDAIPMGLPVPSPTTKLFLETPLRSVLPPVRLVTTSMLVWNMELNATAATPLPMVTPRPQVDATCLALAIPNSFAAVHSDSTFGPSMTVEHHQSLPPPHPAAMRSQPQTQLLRLLQAALRLDCRRIGTTTDATLTVLKAVS